jgi:catechol 2,3-dioxygenase-like lactoylglutathione lyase family enzyme
MMVAVRRTNTILYCRHWRETVAFFRDVLGLTVAHTTDWLVEFRLTADSFVSIAEAARTTIASAEGAGITLSLQVDDLDGLHRHLAEADGRPGPIQPKWGARVFYFHDPEGHRLEAWQGE